MRSKIKDRVSSVNNDDKSFIASVIRIMREFPAYDYEKVMNLPIPVYLEMVEYIIKLDESKTKNGK